MDEPRSPPRSIQKFAEMALWRFPNPVSGPQGAGLRKVPKAEAPGVLKLNVDVPSLRLRATDRALGGRQWRPRRPRGRRLLHRSNGAATGNRCGALAGHLLGERHRGAAEADHRVRSPRERTHRRICAPARKLAPRTRTAADLGKAPLANPPPHTSHSSPFRDAPLHAQHPRCLRVLPDHRGSGASVGWGRQRAGATSGRAPWSSGLRAPWACGHGPAQASGHPAVASASGPTKRASAWAPHTHFLTRSQSCCPTLWGVFSM